MRAANAIGVLAFGLCLTSLAGCSRERGAIAQDLKSDRPEVRAAALGRLAAFKDEQDLPIFIARSQDHAAVVRRAAAEALGTLREPRGVDVLGSLLADPDDDVQTAAVQSLAAIPGEKSRAYLLNAYGRRGTVTRAAIARAFGMGPSLQDAVRREADAIWERTAKALESGGAAEKVGAAEELGRSGRAEAIERLLPLLGNDAILLAAGAARGLGAAGDKKAVPLLMAVLKENYPQLREAAAQALGDLGDPQAAPVLAGVAAGSDEAALEAVTALTELSTLPMEKTSEVRQALCQVASSAGSPTGAALAAKALAGRGGCPLEPLLARLAKGGSDTRIALAALGYLGAGQEQVAAKVIRFLDDRDPATRLAAVHAAGLLGNVDGAPPLARIVKSEGERLALARAKWIKEPLPTRYASGFASVRGVAGDAYGEKLSGLLDKVHANNVAKAKAMGQSLHEAAPDPVPEVLLDTDPDEGKLLGAAAEALGRVHGPDAQALLEPLADDADAEVRIGALVGLACLGGEANLTRVAKAWASLPPEGVAPVARALGMSGKAGEPSLIAGLSARDADRTPIAQLLGDLGDPSAAEPLEHLLTAGGEESVAAAQALGKLGQVRSAKPLLEVLKDPHAAARLEATQALGAIKEPQARAALERELFADRPEIRAAAARALNVIGAGDATPELEALRADYYREVRQAVEEALRGVAVAQH